MLTPKEEGTLRLLPRSRTRPLKKRSVGKNIFGLWNMDSSSFQAET